MKRIKCINCNSIISIEENSQELEIKRLQKMVADLSKKLETRDYAYARKEIAKVTKQLRSDVKKIFEWLNVKFCNVEHYIGGGDDDD